MTKKSQNKNILLAMAALGIVIAVTGIIGFFTLGNQPEIIQGEVEVSEYRVSSKVPGRIVELRVKEGDYVKVGDTLAIIDAPDIEAKKMQALSAENAADAVNKMTEKGARQEQIRGAYQVWQQAKAGREIAKKSYERVQRLYDEGVMTAQKRDEALANYKALEAQEQAAKSQYDMAVNGARQEEKLAAAAQASRARGAVQEINSYINEMVQNNGDTFTAYCPAFNKDIKMKVYYIKDQGSYAVWKATKSNGQYDLKTFEVRARPIEKTNGLRPGMSLILKDKTRR